MIGTNTDTLDQEEAAAYKAQAVNAKFKQQISYGIGAAMVFGLVSVVVSVLLKDGMMGAFAVGGGGIAAAALPILGLVGLGAIGVGLLYLSAKYLSENTLRDQHLQARQISGATRGVAPVVIPVVAPKVQEFPQANTSKAEISEVNAAATPTNFIGNERALSDTVVARAPAKDMKQPAARAGSRSSMRS